MSHSSHVCCRTQGPSLGVDSPGDKGLSHRKLCVKQTCGKSPVRLLALHPPVRTPCTALQAPSPALADKNSPWGLSTPNPDLRILPHPGPGPHHSALVYAQADRLLCARGEGREEKEPLLAIKRWELRHASITGICFLNVPFVLTLDPSKIY